MSAITAAPAQPSPAVGTRPLLRVLRAEWERSLAWTLATGAVVLLFLGYRNVAGSPFAAEEVAHLIAGGLGALLLLAASLGLLLSADLRDEADKLDRIAARLNRPPVAVVSSRPARRPAGGGERAVASAAAGIRPARGIRLACTAVAVVGLVFLVAGWARAAGTADFDRSLTGLAAAVLGFGLITAGISVHSLAARRLVRMQIGALVAAGFRTGQSPAGAATAADGREWTADGLARFHLRSCPALASAPGPARPVDGPAARLEPCLLCHVED
jgi:hypothetical protein